MIWAPGIEAATVKLGAAVRRHAANSRRVGAFSAASVSDRRTACLSAWQTSTSELTGLAPTGAEPSMEDPAESPVAVRLG
jgi:hypothetical protein